ncbi:MAG TPA: sugar-transfer associated ATP-grasp domain-containing protein [Sphingobacteriaceae bacterium]|nr:sugar-transfer associated ATP-grasp domain-containing protein [Sphingobacteriaceae bacterium]
MQFKRLLYLGYYLKELDKKKFKAFLNYVSSTEHIPKTSILLDIIGASLKHNISILEYFQFHFYKLSSKERETFAGTGYMYEYQLKMNPKASRQVLENKLEFLMLYNQFIHHDFASLKDIKEDHAVAQRLLSNKSGKVVLKNSIGQCGHGIEVKNCNELNAKSLIHRLEKTGNDLVEEFVVQHKDLMKLSPSGLNTIRIITQLDKNNNVEVLGARLRITVNSTVDNLAAGNIAAPIDLETGIVDGPGVYSDITKPSEVIHPITKISVLNFKVPYWKETMEMVKKAAMINKHNQSIGWDIAITDEGPELIEGNHDWCKLLWQLPVNRGLKPSLEKYIK